MAEHKGFYDVYSSGDRLEPADRLKIEHSIYISDVNTDISKLTPLSVDRLQTMRGDSAAAEQVIFDKLREATAEWEAQAAQTQLLDKAIEYVRTPAVQHTSNQWGKSNVNNDRQSMSNRVYAMSYYVYERTRYDRAVDKSVPVAWELSWSVYTNAPTNQKRQRIAGQDKKVYSDKSDMERYLNGRIKAYSHLFTEISPPIPKEYADSFRVNGLLLPGYTVEGEAPEQPYRAATMSPELIEEAREAAHAAGLPFSEIPYNGREFDPYVYDGSMIPEDYELMQKMIAQERSEKMDDFINLEAYISNLGKYTKGRPAGEWVRFPATAEHLKEVFDRIGIDGKNYESWHITQYNSAFKELTRHFSEYENLDELNYLGKLLEMQGDGDRDKFAAAVTHGEYAGSVKDLINLAQNLDCYWLYPSVHSEEDYGYYLIDELDTMELPQEAKKYFMYEEYGRDSIINEGGELTDQGYIYNNRNTFTEWYDGRDVPEEYRVTPQSEQDAPNIDYDAIATRQPAVATVKPPEQVQPQPVIPLVLQSEKPGEKLKEITDKLEQGIKGVFESGQYETYLKTMSKFHNYSFNNTMLIFMQKPDASHIAGFNAWKSNFERSVRKGEKGIKIIAPSPFKVKEQQEKIDPVSQKPVIGRDGKAVTEEVEVKIPAYKVVSVFDVSQTDGKELPTIGVDELTGSVEQYKDFFAALEKASPVPVAFEEIEGGANGYYHLEDKRIAIREGMSELQTLKTAIHEIAHARLHDVDVNAPKDEQPRVDKRSREVEAESIAYTVCQHYGLDTSDYSFGYVAGWSSDKELTELKASLETIRGTAAGLITEIDGHFADLQKDREQTVEQEQDTPEQGDTYSIYQLKHEDSTRDYRFEPFDRLQSAGLAVDPANYERVYTAPITADTDNLEKIFEKFNIDHPEDFKGHSLSVSDIVTFTRDGRETAHYVDSIGYEEVPQFLQPTPDSFLTGERIETPRGSFSLTGMTTAQMEAAGYGYHHSSDDNKYHIMGNGTQAFAIINENNPLRTAEMSTEQNYNMIDGIINNTPTVDELEARAKAGERISLLDLANAVKAEKHDTARDTGKKPSIREQLKADKQKIAAAPKKAAVKNQNNDLEV